jgi:hypothetical protein
MGDTVMTYPTVIIENLIEEDTLDLIQSSFSNLHFQLNLSAKQENDSTLRFYDVDQNFTYYDFIKKIDDKIENLIKAHYSKDVESFTGQAIVRYIENQHIGTHRDWKPNDEWVVLNMKKTVHLSSVFYFNDDYSGGDLVFYNDNKEKYFFIKPKKNCLILFDALQYHSTIPIVSGVKYSYTNFYTLKD